MRLLNTTSIEVENFPMGTPPEYAILSHRWDAKEVTFEDMKPGGVRDPRAMLKLHNSCALAKRHGFQYIWIDTCCVDKSSSAELSEVINSMFRYYKEAKTCYAYLSDVASVHLKIPLRQENLDFAQSAWFTRGWTLQELIAPKNLRFYNKDWTFLGDKSDLEDAIQSITGIPTNILKGGDLDVVPVSKKMSWVASRRTSVPEDIAYCLLGIFDVNIPLLYGEGEEKAFLRLQEAILKLSDDNSIFLWQCTEKEALERPLWGLLASSPSHFSRSPQIDRPCTSSPATKTAATLSGRGVNVEFVMGQIPEDDSKSLFAAVIGIDGSEHSYGPLLKKTSYSGGEFIRVKADILLGIENLNTTGTLLFREDKKLEGLQPLRFFVRQNPKIRSTLQEAVGISFDPVKSVPPGMHVCGSSSRWKGQDIFLITRNQNPSTFLLECSSEYTYGLQSTRESSRGNADSRFISGVLQLVKSETSADRRELNFTLCTGVERFPTDRAGSCFPYWRPWCQIFETRIVNLSRGRKLIEECDQVLGAYDSYVREADATRATIKAEADQKNDDFGGQRCHFARYEYPAPPGWKLTSQYVASFELQLCHGRVYYLIKITDRNRR
ncbi:hypothetical protein VTL71DRAFT_7175 [Oculimacula yallundae]|uniref:Heterokaryon incompatibility domain-containing protein n=1 Tax=Oculimacula yallundae TaxID=86028 RepID=A0ABR4BVY8_9HELO